MSWSEHQRLRLALERQLLKQHMPGFDLLDPSGATYASGKFTSNSGRIYSVRVNLPERYPDACPKVYITDPMPLWGYRGFFGALRQKTIASYGVSHDMHTLGVHDRGWVQVCHFRSERWSASSTLVQVLVKVRLWLEAYEAHCRTGRPIDDFLMTQS